jgi:hypothetical protein
MAFTKNVNSLIADRTGAALKDFLAATPDAWATENMARRYNAAPPSESDEPGSFPVRCYDHLKNEHRQLRAWFTEPEFKVSALLQSRFLSAQFSGPLNDGFGWDFRRDGDAEPRMIQFKATLIACYRQMDMLPSRDRNVGNISVGGIARLVGGAYRARAEVHMWRPFEKRNKDDTVELVCSGEDLAKRWVAFRTMSFLARMGLDPSWAWDTSGCRRIFGIVDEVPSSDSPGSEA